MKSKIINNGITGAPGVNGNSNSNNLGNSGGHLPKELPNIQTRSIGGGMNQGG